MAIDLEKIPSPVNKPASGTYGEKAAVDKLKSALPAMSAQPGPGGPPEPSPMSDPSAPNMTPPGRPAMSPPGVPGSLLHPTSRPDVPLNSPLDRPGQENAGVGMAPAADQARRALLQQMVVSPQVSQVTREWAKNMLEMLSD